MYIAKMKIVLYQAFVKLLENVLSKKFLVFVVATALLGMGMLPPEHWSAVALAVLGVVSAIDFRHGTSSFDKRVQNKQSEPKKLNIP